MKTNLKKLLSITLACVMLVMCMGAYSGEIDVDRKTMQSMKNCGDMGKSFSAFKNIENYEKYSLYDSDGINITSYLYEYNDEKAIDIGYAIISAKDGSIIEFALGESPYSAILPIYLKKNNIRQYLMTYGGPTFYGIINISRNKIMANSNEIIEFVKFVDMQKSEDELKKFNYNIRGTSAKDNVTFDGFNTMIGGVGNQTATNGLYCTDAALANMMWYWNHCGYDKITSKYRTISDLAWYFRNNNEHGSNGGVSNGVVNDSMYEFVNQYYPGTFAAKFSYTEKVAVPMDDIVTTINNGYPGILTLSKDPKYGDHAVVTIGFSFYQSAWIYIQDGWTGNAIMIAYTNAKDTGGIDPIMHNLNYLYER